MYGTYFGEIWAVFIFNIIRGYGIHIHVLVGGLETFLFSGLYLIRFILCKLAPWPANILLGAC